MSVIKQVRKKEYEQTTGENKMHLMIPDFCFGDRTDICNTVVTLHSFFSCVISETQRD
jgi:hypothetical protein